MNIKKHILSLVVGLAIVFSTATASLAQIYTDVTDDFWAAQEIHDVVTKDIIYLNNDSTFRPWDKVTRVEFTGMLIRALGLNQAPITAKPSYPDINASTPGYNDIARSDQFGLVYGYTDGLFRPTRYITKAETESIMSHITKDTEVDTSILNKFSDAKDIPNWDIIPFAKAVKYGLYVNYPLETELNPNRDLNRAEAAVLLAKLRNALNLVEDQYKAEEVVEEEPVPEEPREYVISTEHLNEYPNAVVNKVTMTNLRKIILAKNVFRVAFLEPFNSKKHNIGDTEVFYFKKDVRTVEGTLIIPANTKLYATVQELRDKRWLNKNAEVYFAFTKMIFPNGHEYPFIARVLNDKEGVLTENYWLKPLEYTIAGAAVGTGAGLGIGAGANDVTTGLAIGLPTGTGVGLLTGWLTPGVNFKARANEEVLVELKVDCALDKD